MIKLAVFTTTLNLLVASAVPIPLSEVNATESNAYDALNEVTEYTAETVQLIDEGTVVTSEINDQKVTIDDSYKVQIEKDKGACPEIGFSFDTETEMDVSVVNDVAVIDCPEGNYQITTEVFEGAIRNCFIINDKSSPEEYKIDYTLPEGSVIDFAVDEYDNTEDGSIIIKNADGKIVGAVGIPWAKDANGNNVETYYAIDGQSITQYIKHQENDAVAYPIVADPTLSFDSCFDSGNWITRDGVISLSLKPNGTLRMAMIQGSTSMRDYSWEAVVSKYSRSGNWHNTESMKDQYRCHWYFAQLKSEFNLEPSRPKTNWANMIAHRCNP